MDEGGTDLVQVAEMHDPNTAVQVCAGSVSHWPLPSSRHGVTSNTPSQVEERSTKFPRDENVTDPSRDIGIKILYTLSN